MNRQTLTEVPLLDWQKPKRRWLYAPSVVGVAIALGLLVWHPTGPGEVKALSELGGGLVLLGLAIIVLLHVLVPGQIPLDRMVSDYARSRRFGFLMNIAFVLIGSSGMILGSCLYEQFDHAFGWTVAAAGAAIILLSVLTTRSTLRIIAGLEEGWFHDAFVGVGFTLVMVTMVWLGVSGVDIGSLSWTHAVGISQFNVSLVAAIAMAIVCLNRRRGSNPADSKYATGQGLCERALILLMIEWVAFLSWALISGLSAAR